MLSETMPVAVEVWCVAADGTGIWLLDGDSWRSPNVPADDEPHSEVERRLAVLDATARVVHSTSWRVDGSTLVVTYLAVVDVGGGLALDGWPDARPVPASLFDAVGSPGWHDATSPPTVRLLDVLFHALRHLAYLVEHDDAIAAALDDHWVGHLAPLEPALATMYTDKAA